MSRYVWPPMQCRCPVCKHHGPHQLKVNLARRRRRVLVCAGCNSEFVVAPLAEVTTSADGVPQIHALGYSAAKW